MAHAHADVWATSPKVKLNSIDEIEIKVGAVRPVMLRDEAASLAADLLDVVGKAEQAA